LCEVGKKVKEFFPELIHTEHFMSRITMQEKSLRKKGQIPMSHKKGKND
jgi:hypothetical protein